MHDYVVYILRCNDNSLYTGMTSDLEERIYQHKTGVYRTCYTFKRRPIELVFTTHFHDVHDAISLERRVKRWNREKKEALIRREHEKLPNLSICKNGTHSDLFTAIACHAERSRSVLYNILKSLDYLPVGRQALGMTQNNAIKCIKFIPLYSRKYPVLYG